MESAAGLRLKPHKCALVPLWAPFSPAMELEKRRWLVEVLPGWGRFNVVSPAKYLGFLMGPEGGTRSWASPVAKRTGRVARTGASGALAGVAAQLYSPLRCPFSRTSLAAAVDARRSLADLDDSGALPKWWGSRPLAFNLREAAHAARDVAEAHAALRYRFEDVFVDPRPQAMVARIVEEALARPPGSWGPLLPGGCSGCALASTASLPKAPSRGGAPF